MQLRLGLRRTKGTQRKQCTRFPRRRSGWLQLVLPVTVRMLFGRPFSMTDARPRTGRRDLPGPACGRRTCVRAHSQAHMRLRVEYVNLPVRLSFLVLRYLGLWQRSYRNTTDGLLMLPTFRNDPSSAATWNLRKSALKLTRG
jgi:hypothetical protein